MINRRIHPLDARIRSDVQSAAQDIATIEHEGVTVQLNWPPEVVDRLSDEVRQSGLSLKDYVLQTVLHQKTPNGTALSDEPARRQARQEAGRSIRELRRGNVLGPDLTIRDLLEEGRRI